MDPLSDFLDGPRARGAFVLHVVMRPPWSMAISGEAPVTVMPQLTGRSWFAPDDGPPEPLDAGDVLLVRSPTPYVLSSQLGDRPTISIGAGQLCSGADGRDLADRFSAGLRRWGNDPAGPDQMLVGTYRSDGEVGRVLLPALPPYAIVHEPAPQVVALLAQEAGQGGRAATSRGRPVSRP